MSSQFSYILSKIMLSLIENQFFHYLRWKAGETVSVRTDRLNQKAIVFIPWTLAGAESVFGGEKAFPECRLLNLNINN